MRWISVQCIHCKIMLKSWDEFLTLVTTYLTAFWQISSAFGILLLVVQVMNTNQQFSCELKWPSCLLWIWLSLQLLLSYCSFEQSSCSFYCSFWQSPPDFSSEIIRIFFHSTPLNYDAQVRELKTRWCKWVAHYRLARNRCWFESGTGPFSL